MGDRDREKDELDNGAKRANEPNTEKDEEPPRFPRAGQRESLSISL